MDRVSLVNESEAVGWLASSVAYFLKTGDERTLRSNYGLFLRSSVCDPELKAVLPSTKRERRKSWRMP